jgi:hypothetical protein
VSVDTTLRRDQIASLLQDLEQRQRDHLTASGPPIWGPQVQAQSFWQVEALAVSGSAPLRQGRARKWTMPSTWPTC